jgi:hypothetical protein
MEPNQLEMIVKGMTVNLGRMGLSRRLVVAATQQERRLGVQRSKIVRTLIVPYKEGSGRVRS